MKTAHVAFVATAIALFISPWLAGPLPVRSAEPPVISARQALTRTVTQLNIDGQSLEKVIDYLRSASGANILVNWKVLEQAGIQRDTAITLNVRQVPVRKVLQLVMNQASPQTPLAYDIDSNVIEITTQEQLDHQLVTKVYIVDDLVMVPRTVPDPPTLSLSAITNGGTQTYGNGGGGGGAGGGFGGGNNGGSGNSSGGSGGNSFFTSNNNNTNAQPQQTSTDKGNELVALIKEMIRPDIWSDAGGPASIRYFGGKLIVTAPASVHEAINGPVGNGGTIRYGM